MSERLPETPRLRRPRSPAQGAAAAPPRQAADTAPDPTLQGGETPAPAPPKARKRQSKEKEVARDTEFFLARQPILNREQHLVAYELLFRRAPSGPADVTDDLSATATVMSHVSQLGIDNVIGEACGFVNVDAAVLSRDFMHFLPVDKLVFEILETVRINPALIARIKELVAMGFSFALDDIHRHTREIEPLIPLVKFIKVDITLVAPEALGQVAREFKEQGKKILAEKVETKEQFEACMRYGFDYFQGFYFARPDILSGVKMAPSQLRLVHIMTLLLSSADEKMIERRIRAEGTLEAAILSMVNTPGLGAGPPIHSLREALAILGRRQLQRWVQVALYAGQTIGTGAVSPLLVLATTRGRLMELIAQKLRPGDPNAAEIAFETGILSLLDTLLCKPMDRVIMQVELPPEVVAALLHRSGFYGDLLTLAESVERIEEKLRVLRPVLHKLGLSVKDLQELELQAFEWSNTISQSAL